MEDDHPIETDHFPDKPLEEQDSNTILKSIGSLVLFIGAFYLFFDRDIQFILLLVLVLFVHELGHFVAMKIFNYTDVKMFFIPLLGAMVTGNKRQISQRQRAIVLLAGPVPGIIIGVILFVLGTETNNSDLIMAANIFVFLNILNLLPVTPLDGGNLAATLFFNKKDFLQTIFLILSALALTAIALYFESYVLLVIPFFLLLRLSGQSRIKNLRTILDKEELNYDQSYEDLTNREYWLIREQVITNMVAFKNVDPKEYQVSKQEKTIISQIKGLSANKPISDLSATAKSLFIGSWLLFGLGPFLVLAPFLSGDLQYIVPEESPETYRNRMVQDCIYSEEGNPEELDAKTLYCECATDTLISVFSKDEIDAHAQLDDEALLTLYQPYIEHCADQLYMKMLTDSLGILLTDSLERIEINPKND